MGQALAMMIALPLVAVMYGIMNGGLFDVIEEGGSALPTVLWLLPSSWGADIVVIFLRNPGDLGGNWQITVIGFGTLLMFFIGSLYVGSKLSGRAYDLEPVGFSSTHAAREGGAYWTVRTLTGKGQFSVVVVSLLKDYTRRMENLSRVIYVVGLVVLMELFLLDSLPSENYASVALLMISWMMAFLCVFVVGEVTARGKDNLFVYRKAPHGETRLIWARVVQGWLVVQPVSVVSALVVLLPAGLPWQQLISYILAVVAISSAYVLMSIGLFLLSPAFSDRPSKTIKNALSVLAISFLLYVLCLALFGDPQGIWALVVLSWALGMILLTAGGRKIRTVE
jgi:hypothetical protein